MALAHMQNVHYLKITTGPNTNIKTQKGFNKETKPV
jgi:hypothetical protein